MHRQHEDNFLNLAVLGMCWSNVWTVVSTCTLWPVNNYYYYRHYYIYLYTHAL